MSADSWHETLPLGCGQSATVWTVRGHDAYVFFSPTPGPAVQLTRAWVETFARSFMAFEDRVVFAAPGRRPVAMDVSRAQGEALIELLRVAAKFAGA